MNTLSRCCSAYIAGLVDADGTISLTRKHINENRHPVVSISNTDRCLLEFVLEKCWRRQNYQQMYGFEKSQAQFRFCHL